MKCDYQAEEKAKKDATHLSHLNEKRRNVENMTSKIQMMGQEALFKDTTRMLSLAGCQQTHEKVSHL